MSFKLRSTFFIVEPTKGGGVGYKRHQVWSKEKPLFTGEEIHLKTHIYHDVEMKGLTTASEGIIRIVDGKTLGVRFRPTFSEGLFHAGTSPEISGIGKVFSEAREFSRWGEEEQTRMKKAGEVDLYKLDPYVDGWPLPEVFTLADKIRFKRLAENALTGANSKYETEVRTGLIYAP